MLRHFSALIVVVLIGTIAGLAQKAHCGSDAASTISTDRPQITSSSIVVPCGSLQFENGFQETSSGGRDTYDFPETSIRFGVARKTELRYMIPNYYWNFASGSGGATGLSDMSLGLKHQLGPVKGVDVSILPSISFPTGANAISSHGYDPTVQAPWSRGLSKNWTVAGMFSVAWPTQVAVNGGTQRNVTGQGSVFFDRQLTCAVGCVD